MKSDSPIGRLLDAVQWTPLPPPNDDSETHATHTGLLHITGIGPLRVYRLNTGERVIDADDLCTVFAADVDGAA
jgi:hypothetical protein